MNVAGNRAQESTKHRGAVAAAGGTVRNTKSTAERLLVTGRPKTTSSTPTDKSMGTLEDIINPLNLNAAYRKVRQNQSKLLEVLARTVKDGRVISLISKYLRAGVVKCGKFEETTVGVPQGGPLSPLCANIILQRAGFVYFFTCYQSVLCA